MNSIQTIRTICDDCKDDARQCEQKACILWPFAGGHRKRPWPDRVQACSYSPLRAIEMYGETLQ